MAFEFKLPDIGEGVVEGEIVKWLVRAGDRVEVDQPMVEVMTDKATVVIPSPKAGVVKETRGGEGETVEVHSVIVIIDEQGGTPSKRAAEAPAARTPPKKEASAPARTPPKKEASAPARTPPKEEAPARPAPEEEAAPAPEKEGAPSAPSGAKVLAAPATRRLARELNVELQSVSGTGPAGRVTSDDVRRASQAPASAKATPAPKAPLRSSSPAEVAGDQRIPVRGLRKRIWENMAQSVFTAAHFTFVEECDSTELSILRERFNGKLGAEDPKLTFLPFIVKAVVASLKRFPMLNGHVDDDAMEFIQRGTYNIGIAVASERGLVVPVVRHADRRSLKDLTAEIRRLANAVRTNSLTTDDLGGSSFTITSLGKEGGIFATPIINYPEVAIMGVHKMVKRPMVMGDQIAIRDMMNLSLSFDHRLVDGHVGAAFTYSVINLLQDPDRLIMEMA